MELKPPKYDTIWRIVKIIKRFGSIVHHLKGKFRQVVMGGLRGKRKLREEGIRVLVRVRPAATYGAPEESKQVIEVNGERTCVSVRDGDEPQKVTQCTFDRVLGPESSQEDVFLQIAPALETVVEGFNACILAYGHTGSGKTHTLIGPGGGTTLAHERIEWGVIPRAVEFLFDRLADASEGDETFAYSVSCSFLQIYNENLVDLLQDGGHSGRSLQIREERARGRETGDKSQWKRSSNRTSALYENRRVFVNGLSSFRVGGAEDVLRYISIGAANRRVRATKHNEASSRSHAVLQIVVEAESGGCQATASGPPGGGVRGDGNVTYRQAKLSLVDLAGSEKMDSMLNTSRGHFNELRSINQSLSTLGNVVSALAEKGRVHVPYRDSKLTRLLQDSLGGNTRTTIIACISPLAECANETMSTLHFADRARRVMVRLRPNEVIDDRVLLERARAEIVRLKKLLRQALDKTLHDTDADTHEVLTETNASDLEPDIRTARPRVGITQEQTETADEAAQGQQLAPGFREQSSGFAAQEIAPVSPSTRDKRARAMLMTEIERLREENERLRVNIDHLLHEKQQRRRRRTRTTNRRPNPSPRRWNAARQIPGSPSGGRTPSLAPAAASTFERRRFEEDDTDHGGSEELHDPPFTADELRDILGEDTSSLEEDKRQEELETAAELQVFRSQLKNLTEEAPATLHPETGGDVTGVPGEIREFQQLEDQMFAAQGRQKRCIRLEKARFRAAQNERIALEAELKALTASETSSTALNLSQSRESLSPPQLSLLKDDGYRDGDRHAPGDVAQNSDTSLENDTTRRANGATGNGAFDNGKWARVSGRFGLRGKARSPWRGEVIRNDVESGRRGSTPGSSKAIPRAMTPLSRRPQRRQITQMGWTTPSRRSASRRRPASSVRAYGRASSWLSRGKPAEARSPVRGEPTFEAPAQGGRMSPNRRKQNPSSPADFNEEMIAPQGAIRGEGAIFKQTTLRNSRTRHRRGGTPSTVSGRHRKLQEGDRGSEDTGKESEGGEGMREGQEGESKLLDAETPKPRLRYGVADLGLRLRVYSFRYDHHYECQIVGYDSRRRMHRCAYDVTGEKQWHDLKTKRFEIVGRNGVLVRSSESAPTAICPSRF